MTDIHTTLREDLKELTSPANLLQVAFIAIILIALYLISTVNYLLFHGIVELAGIAVAFSIFIIVWNTRRVITDGFFLIIGISFLFFGSIDLVHTLAFKGMGVFPGNSSDLPTQLWIAARYFQSITFLVATLFIGRSITRNRKYDVGIIIAACTAACTLLIASIFVWQNFPHCFIESSGLTPFKIASEYIISLIFIATIAILYLKREHFDPTVWKFLIAAQVFLILGELAFTSYISVFGFMNMLGHLFRLLSVYLFYRAFVVISLTRPYDLLLRELKVNEDRLRDNRGKYRDLVENIDEVIFSSDLQGNLTFISPVIMRLYGYTPSEMIGQHFLNYVLPDDRSHYIEGFRRRLNGDYERDEFRFLARSGTIHYVSISPRPMEKDGRIVGFNYVMTDITERKRTEEALRQVNKQLNLLSSITRHDILNQLMALKGYLELSHDVIDNPTTLIEYIKKEEQAANIIEHQITFTKDYQDLGAAAPAWQNVNASIEKAIVGLPMRGVRAEVDPKAPDIFVDPLFAKVFYNLIDNALRYGGAGMKTIRFSSQESDTSLAIVCEDDGVGVPADKKEAIFTRGFGKNTGLGLFLSREILSITGITITENGEPGKGARFEICVPSGIWRMKEVDA